jgi:protein gp37
MENSKIEWTDHTANPWWGCTKVHAGCDNCYAEYFSDVRYKKGLWGNDNPRQEVKSFWKLLDKLQKEAARLNSIKTVFVGSMMDIFERPMPVIDSKGNLLNYDTGDIREKLFEAIDLGKYNNLLFLFLTKRPSNIRKYIPAKWLENPPTNIMYGTSPVNQETFNNLVGQLINVKGRKFLSIEPQLDFISVETLGFTGGGINWIIQGGESGPHKRPFNLEWARALRDECKSLMIPYFFKQIDKVREIPEDLKVRQFPDVQTAPTI